MSMISVQRAHVLRPFGQDFIGMIRSQAKRKPINEDQASGEVRNARKSRTST